MGAQDKRDLAESVKFILPIVASFAEDAENGMERVYDPRVVRTQVNVLLEKVGALLAQ